MSTEQLADLLLPAGHPPIKSAKVHPWGMEANFPYPTNVELFGVPELSNDLCRQQVFEVGLSPAEPVRPPLADDADFPSRPTETKSYEQIRLADLDAPMVARCTRDDEGFFELASNASSEKVELVRRFYALIRSVRSGKRVPFKLTFSDEYAKEVNRFGAAKVEAIGNARDALDRFPTFTVSYVDLDPVGVVDRFPLAGSYPRTGNTRWAKLTGAVGGALWEADLVFRGSSIARVHLRRRIIPPF